MWCYSLWSGTPNPPQQHRDECGCDHTIEATIIRSVGARTPRCLCSHRRTSVRDYRYVYKLTQYMRAATAVWPVRTLNICMFTHWWSWLVRRSNTHTIALSAMAKWAGAALFKPRHIRLQYAQKQWFDNCTENNNEKNIIISLISCPSKWRSRTWMSWVYICG